MLLTGRPRRLALVAGGATAALTFGLAVGLRDRDALLLTIGLGLAVGLTARWARLGAVALAVLLADVAVWMGLALLSHLGHDDSITSVLLSALLFASAVTGLGALAVGVLERERPDDRPARRRARPALAAALGLAWGVAATVVVVVAPSMVSVPKAEEGKLVISIRNSKFSANRLESHPGFVTLVVANPDLFWHTFTVPDLDIDVTVPVGSVREATLNLRKGTYDYLCRVPGHNRMIGKLVVA
jgi:plastocyanin